MKKSSVERQLTDQQRAEADVKTIHPNAVKAEKVPAVIVVITEGT